MTTDGRNWWRAFWRGYSDPRVWAWMYPAIAALDIWAFTSGDDGWRWVCLGFAVLFLIEAGWAWRELAERRKQPPEIVVTIWPTLADFDNHRSSK